MRGRVLRLRRLSKAFGREGLRELQWSAGSAQRMNRFLHNLRRVYVCWTCNFIGFMTEAEIKAHEASEKHQNRKRNQGRP